MAPDPIRGFGEFGAEAGQAFRSAWEAVPEPLMAFDTGQELIFANSPARRLLAAFGVSPRPGLRREIKFFDPVTQESLPPERLPVARAMRGEPPGLMELLIRPVNPGTCFWLECDAQPFYWNGPEIRGVVLLFRDITARKRRELTRDSTEQLREFIYQGNLAAIIRTTVDGRIIDCNEALVRMLGYSSADELRTVRSPQLYWDASDRSRLLERVNLKREVREAEVRLRRKDGSECWALLNIRLLDPRPDQIGGDLVTTAIDITERRNWEETLRQSESRFTAFMRHLPGVAFIKDLDGRYIYYNEASWPQFHKRPEDFVGKVDEQLWPTDDAARYRENDAAVIAGGRPVEFIEPVTAPNGQRSWLICKFPIIEDGKVVLVGGIGIDITERASLEDQLTQARKMEALGRLAGGVAHDFNNLLTVISGYGQLAIESLGSSPPERLMSYMQEILNSARRASGMTGQLLAFSRRQAVQPRVLDLCDVLRNVEHLLQRMIGEHVDLHVHCCHEPCLVRADPHQIEQVLMNLAVNARDAMPLGGLLEIDCGLLPAPIERPGLPHLGVKLEVRDTGVGMDESVKARMFEPFFTSKDKGKGTGLGLSTVYGVVSQAGGEIEVESEPGQGSRFLIYFPLAAGKVEEPPALSADAAPVGLETVLLVEDEPGVRLLAETVLRKLGYKVLVADSGEAALKIWKEKQNSIDILLTDVIMPQMSGGDLAHKLRSMNPRLKILFMSGYTDDMIASHGVLAGETQLIQKPFTAEALGRRLRGVLDA
ncbi:MAG TPA: PAS domain-containing protein [Bryobacteraceae bacterium]|jgi:PAS domain S-box-containing protein|nr:PAS domain-containing protein [Bryobacteraceae bacterium]